MKCWPDKTGALVFDEICSAGRGRMFGILGLGFLLGMQHALETDHIAAVSSIAARRSHVRNADSGYSPNTLTDSHTSANRANAW